MKKILLLLMLILGVMVVQATTDAQLEGIFSTCPGWAEFEPQLLEYCEAENMADMPFVVRMQSYFEQMYVLPDVDMWWAENGWYTETDYSIKCVFLFWFLHTGKTHAKNTWCRFTMPKPQDTYLCMAVEQRKLRKLI